MTDQPNRLPTSYWTQAIRADLKRRREEAEAAAETQPTTPRARECETGDNAEEIR